MIGMRTRAVLVSATAAVATTVALVPPASAGPAGLVLETSDATIYEGQSGTNTAVFEVRRIGAFTGKAQTVTWSTADGTASAGEDYAAAAGSLTFDKKNEVQYVRISVVGDVVQEPDEHFFVRVADSGGGDGEGRGTILNDDGWPVDGA